jgi:Mrp family chromosome partitioning ATPase
VLREYDLIIVDCPGNLEDTDSLVGVRTSATFVVISTIPERAAVQLALWTARLCTDYKVPYRS